MPERPVGTVGMMLVEKNGDLMIRDVLPGTPAAQSKAIMPGEKLLSIAVDGAGEVPAATLDLERASQMLTGEPGSTVRVTVAPPYGDAPPRVVLLTREPLPRTATSRPPSLVQVVDPMAVGMDPFAAGQGGSGFSKSANPMALGMGAETAGASGIPSSSPAALVRIYPVGFAISGDENQLLEKQKSLEQVIMESLEHAKLHTEEKLVLSLHRGTKVLIVKATAAQHEIIQQIITALKENESAGAQGSNSLRR
jgi:hypothetical protein